MTVGAEMATSDGGDHLARETEAARAKCIFKTKWNAADGVQF